MLELALLLLFSSVDPSAMRNWLLVPLSFTNLFAVTCPSKCVLSGDALMFCVTVLKPAIKVVLLDVASANALRRGDVLCVHIIKRNSERPNSGVF